MLLAILHGLCGFYLQILPCSFFCLYPFYDSFRYPRKRVLTAMGAALGILSVIFTYFYATQDIYANENTDSYLLLNIIFLLTLEMLLGAYLFLIKAQIVHKLFFFILVANYGFLMTEAVSYTTEYILNAAAYMYSDSALILHVLFNAILLYPMMDLLRHARKAFRSGIDSCIWKNLTLVLGIFFAGLLIFYEIPHSAGMDADHVLTLFSKAMELMLIFLCSIVLRTLELAQEQAAKRHALEAAVENYRLMAETTDKVREVRHEMNHHIAALSLLMRDQDYEGAENYLKKMALISSETSSGYYTQHMLLNSMLSEYKKQAEAKQVQVKYVILVPNLVAMEDMDLCQFLSNMLDNALEANSHLNAADKKLSLTIRQSGNFLYFLCENPCDPAHLHLMSNTPGTSKSDKRNHGYGIPIMERIAEKYNGTFRVSTQNGLFTAAANLCMPAEK